MRLKCQDPAVFLECRARFLLRSAETSFFSEAQGPASSVEYRI